MIKYLSEKEINLDSISYYLNLSKKEGKYTNGGPVKRLLEEKLKELLKLQENKEVLCVSNGTAAMQAVMFLYKKHNINNWAIPAYTFPSAVVGNIFNVDIFDISKETYTLELEKIKNYDGIIITNLFGTYYKPDKIEEFCRVNNIKLIFDNAASPLSEYNNINICNFGDYCIGSLHHTKYLGFGEGGFIVCDKDRYDELTEITNFGFPDYKKNLYYSSNYKMSDISAAFILNHINNFNKTKYLEIQNKMILKIGKENIFNYEDGVIYNSLPVLFKEPISIEYYKQNKIIVNKYYKPLLELAENSKYLYERIINLPLHIDLSKKDIDKIAKVTMIK